MQIKIFSVPCMGGEKENEALNQFLRRHKILQVESHFHGPSNMNEAFEKKQIYDSYASRKGKGTYAALDRAQQFTQKNDWFLKLDVRQYFASIHHQILYKQLYRMFKEKRLNQLFLKIIESYQMVPDRGLPIGNLGSQYFANHYLTGLDHFIKEKLQIKCYIRYMDDMVLWSRDKSNLKNSYLQIQNFIHSNLNLELKTPVLNQSKFGVPFLGYRVFGNHRRLLQSSKRRFLHKYKFIERQYHSGAWEAAKCQKHLQAALAFVLKADTKAFRQRMFND